MHVFIKLSPGQKETKGKPVVLKIRGQTCEFPFSTRCYSIDDEREKGNSHVWPHTFSEALQFLRIN